MAARGRQPGRQPGSDPLVSHACCDRLPHPRDPLARRPTAIRGWACSRHPADDLREELTMDDTGNAERAQTPSAPG